MTAGRKVDSQRVDWGTPLKYVQSVQSVLGKIILDPCSNEWSIVQAEIEYSLPDIDGLKASWDYETIYVNLPYGRDKERKTSIKDWLFKCNNANVFFESEILALIPVATNTSHWKEYIWDRATAICFLYDTRLKFLIEGRNEGKGAPMACAMIYWGKKFNTFYQVFDQHGSVIKL